MSIKLQMPALSPSMESGNLIAWKKNEGDNIGVEDVIAEIETDKAIMDWESIYTGKLEKIIIPSGTNDVQVGTVIGVIREAGDSDEDIVRCIESIQTSGGVDGTAVENNVESAHAFEASTVGNITSCHNSSVASGDTVNAPTDFDCISNVACGTKRVFASPLARNIARNNNVDLAEVAGTGINGRIVKADILDYISKKNTRSDFTKSSFSGDIYTDSAPTGMRNAIANNLCKSKQSIPHFYLSTQAAVDNMLDMRKTVNDFGITGSKLLIDAFIMKSVANAMVVVPDANVSWVDGKIRRFNTVNIAIAIALDGGLVTPVISHVQTKSIVELSDEIHHVVSIVRSGKSSKEHQSPCSITLSNLGMYKAIDCFYSIVPMNNGSILSIAAASKTPIVADDEVVIKNMMKFGYAGDHRCIDGAVAAKFLEVFVEDIQR